MENIQNYLNSKLQTILINYFKDRIQIPDGMIRVVYYSQHGIDYSYKAIFGLKKYLDEHGIKMELDELADIIKTNFDDDNFEIEFERNSLNFNVKPIYLTSAVKNIFSKKNIIQQSDKSKVVVVDFSSPNIAKDMHVGHLRSTIIGESVCRLFEELGHDVRRTNHIGDFGLQFGMLIQYMYEFCTDFDPQHATISDLQTFYAASKKRFDQDEEFKKLSYQRVVQLQSGDPEVVKIWNYFKDISRRSYDAIYERLEVKLDEVGESFYQNMIPDVIKELESKELLEKDNGRTVVKGSGKPPTYKTNKKGESVVKDNGDPPLTVIKSDGGYTYDTTDVAAIRYRLQDLGAEAIYYVIDSGQSLHMSQVFETAKKAGWLTDQTVKHIGFGLVLSEGDGKKFKSRAGDTIKLEALLDEALVRARKVVEDKQTELSKEEIDKVVDAVAYGSVKYADLSSSRTNNYTFSFDKMLSLKGNTAPYLIYAYVRIESILRNAGTERVEMFNHIDEIKVEHDAEISLAKHILQFTDVVDKVSNSLMFHTLGKYLYDLSTEFHNFFSKCRCIHYDQFGEDPTKILKIEYGRLLLCEATRRVMEKCFYILGLKTLERM